MAGRMEIATRHFFSWNHRTPLSYVPIIVVWLLGYASALVCQTHPLRLDSVATQSSWVHMNGKGTQLFVTADTSGDVREPSKLLDKAAKLRKEVEELENQPGRKPVYRTAESMEENVPLYKDLSDSFWMISFRFADRPDNDDETETQQRKQFGGKLLVKFREDGYTDWVSQEMSGPAENSIEITKTWGWDLETSPDENDGIDKNYLLFSLDTKLPDSTTQRFYLQARQEDDRSTNVISLTEGTVTVKGEVLKNSWGFMSPKGILAQFQYVGNFVAKPVMDPDKV